MTLLQILFSTFLSLIISANSLCYDYPARNFINGNNALRLRQTKFINAKNFIPYIYTRTDIPLTIRCTGIMRADTVSSSRPYQLMNLGDAYGIWPLQRIPTQTGGDGYAHSTFSIVNGLFQIGMYAHTQDIGSTKIMSFINGDFTGLGTAIGTFVIHFAYVHLAHGSTSMLIGQYTNPMGIYENFPHVISSNYGAPFLPTAFNPQITLTQQVSNFNIVASAYTQYLFEDTGAAQTFNNDYSGFSSRYVDDAIMPIMHARLEYETDTLQTGIGYNAKRLTPRIVTESLVPTKEHVFNHALMAFAIWRTPRVSYKTQLLFGTDGTDLLMLGAYAVRSVSSDLVRTYSRTRFISWWLEAESSRLLRGKLQPGIFIGYTRNLGTKAGPLELFPTTQIGPDNVPVTLEHPMIYSIDQEQINVLGQKALGGLLRISPRLWVFITEGLQFGIEAQFDRALYAYLDDFARPRINQSHVPALRVISSIQYFF